MKFEITHQVHLHGDPVVICLLERILHVVTTQGAKLMSAADDVVTSLTSLEGTVVSKVVPLLTTVGTELDQLSTLLAQAISAGAAGPAFLTPIKDRMDALNAALNTSADALAAIAAKDAPPAPAPEPTPEPPPAPAPEPIPAPALGQEATATGGTLTPADPTPPAP